MDVLQLLKSEFRERRSEINSLQNPGLADAERKKILSVLDAHLAWESEFLLPELTHIATRGEPVLDKYDQSLKRLHELCTKRSAESLKVVEAFSSHTDIVEDKILPYMRQKIPTGDREELYHVFADAKHEVFANKGVSFAH